MRRLTSPNEPDLTRSAAAEERVLMSQGPDSGGLAPAARPDAPLKLDEFLPYKLNVVANLVSQALSRIYVDRYNIGVPEWRVLVTLGEFGIMTGKAIGAHSHMHKTKVSRAVAELESRNLVVRQANRDDRRESFLSLTPEGRAIYQDLAPGALELSDRLIAAIDPADLEAFERTIERLTEFARSLTAEVAAGRRDATSPSPERSASP
jgi:DNA-binding MarR family transcriptional regulator